MGIEWRSEPEPCVDLEIPPGHHAKLLEGRRPAEVRIYGLRRA